MKLRDKINTGLLVVAAAGGITAAAFSAMPTAGAQSYPPYIPTSIIVGPDSTTFTITDKSRPPYIYYACAFTSPRYTSTNADGTRLYEPAVQCNQTRRP